jgi:hypothetical protein
MLFNEDFFLRPLTNSGGAYLAKTLVFVSVFSVNDFFFATRGGGGGGALTRKSLGPSVRNQRYRTLPISNTTCSFQNNSLVL